MIDMERRQRTVSSSTHSSQSLSKPTHVTKQTTAKAASQKTFPARPYESAIRLVLQGAGVEELISSCGLSTSEAELILTMHGLDKVG